MPTRPRERLNRIGRFLRKHNAEETHRFDDLTDPRDRRGRRWPLATQMRAVWCGMLVGAHTIRQVESLSEDLAAPGRADGLDRRLPDSTLEYVLPDVNVSEMRAKLLDQVHGMQRAKTLEPVGLPFGVLAIDGKTLGAYATDVNGWGQQHTHEDGSPYWLVRVLRAVLVTAGTKPCIDQQPVSAGTNDMGAFADFFDGVMAAYGRSELFELVTLDAGFTSLDNASRIDKAQKGYLMGLKGPQPELLREARSWLEPEVDPRTGTYRVAPEAETPWECHKGRRIRRQLWRTSEMAGYHGWTHLRQVLLVRQTTEDPSGCNPPVIEDRYFMTNLVPGRLNGQQWLQVVRMHWRIENNCFGALDVQWLEDRQLCCQQGNAPLVLGLLRVMAYNVLGWLRGRYLRSEPNRTMTWRELFDRVRVVLVISTLGLLDATAEEPTPGA